MDYKHKYIKYKHKYLNLKLTGGNNNDNSKCDMNFQNLMDLKIDDKDYKVYHGSMNETPCGLDDLYQKCKVYLDTLHKIEEFIIWIYTDGALPRLLNNYLLYDKKLEIFYELPATFYAFCYQIKWYYFFELNKIYDTEDSLKLKTLFDSILLLMWINFKKINKKIFDVDKTASKEHKMDESDKKILSQIMATINNASPKISDSDKIDLMKKFFIDYNDNFPIEFIIDYIINDIDKTILAKYLDLNLSILTKILDGVPSIDRCIKLYKIIGKNSDLYEIGRTYKQKVINSLTCSRTANISIFYDRDKQLCCLLEINCVPGTKILFLNYLKTVFGSFMFEVILPIGYNFKVESSDFKDIITFNFDSKFTKPKTKVLQPIRSLTYTEPKIKKIKVYEISIV